MFDKPNYLIIDNTGNTPGSYTSFIQGMQEAYNNNINNVIVLGSNYNLIEEMNTIYGSDFLDSLSTVAQYGAPIGHNMHVVFPTNAELEFIYTGNNKYIVARSFSPIYTAEGNFTLEGCSIYAKNARYCIHDDNNKSHESHTYRYCNMKLDNSDITNPQNAGIWRCIGGGFGYFCTYYIYNCVFEVIGLPQDNVYTGKTVGIVNYHDNAQGNEGSNYLYINHNVFKGLGTAGATYLGNLSTQSYIDVSYNRIGNDPYVEPENSSGTNNLVLTATGNYN